MWKRLLQRYLDLLCVIRVVIIEKFVSEQRYNEIIEGDKYAGKIQIQKRR
jgi:hypothetical protein